MENAWANRAARAEASALKARRGIPAPFQGAQRSMDSVTFTPELWIKRLEVNDLNFEFVFHEYPGQDGSGEKGFETLDQNFCLPCRKGTPRLSRRSEFVSDTALCPGK